MNLTSVLIVLNENFNALDVLQDNLKVAGSKIQLLVYNHGCKDSQTIEAIKEISSEYIEDFSPIKKTFSECCNLLLRIASGKFICVFYEYGYLEEHWLSILIESHNNIPKSGILAVNNFSCLETSYEMDQMDELVGVYRNEQNIVHGIILFSREVIISIGGFKPHLNLEYLIWDFCNRMTLLGYINYFVPGNSLIKHSKYVDSYYTSSNEYHQEKASNDISTHIKIFECQESDKALLKDLNQNLDINFYYSDKFGSIVFITDTLKPSQLQKISVFLLKHNKELELKSISYFDEYILKNSILGLIVPNNI